MGNHDARRSPRGTRRGPLSLISLLVLLATHPPLHAQTAAVRMLWEGVGHGPLLSLLDRCPAVIVAKAIEGKLKPETAEWELQAAILKGEAHVRELLQDGGNVWARTAGGRPSSWSPQPRESRESCAF